MTTRGETIPKARKAYTVGRMDPRSPPEPLPRRQAIAAAASPHTEEIVRVHELISSLLPHLGQTMSLESAAASGAGISALQCGHVRTAKPHLPFRARGCGPRLLALRYEAFILSFEGQPAKKTIIANPRMLVKPSPRFAVGVL